MHRVAIAAAALAALCVTPASAEDLSLECAGAGTYPQQSTGRTTVIDPTTGTSTVVTGNQTSIANLNAVVRFELAGDTARILMPPVMTPPINGGSDHGWWTLDRLNVTPESITGRFTLNPFNKPRVTIDRMRGTIEVDGNFRYYFLGDCQRIETTPQAPRF